MLYWMVAGGAVAGFLLAVLVAMWLRFGGLLRIRYEEGGDTPYLFLELTENPEKLKKKKYVIFRVKEDSR